MKRRNILWATAILALLMFARCHFVAWPLRHADAVITVRTTGYCACMNCSGWKFNWLGLPVAEKGKLKSIGRTANGSLARPGTVAVDPAVFPLGTKFYIPGYGWGRAEDVSGGKGSTLDLYFWRHSAAEKWGEQNKKVKVWYPRT